jgi:hypothetical protein
VAGVVESSATTVWPLNSYYYLRVIQADKDEHGNPSHAWSSPIWVRKR